MLVNSFNLSQSFNYTHYLFYKKRYKTEINCFCIRTLGWLEQPRQYKKKTSLRKVRNFSWKNIQYFPDVKTLRVFKQIFFIYRNDELHHCKKRDFFWNGLGAKSWIYLNRFLHTWLNIHAFSYKRGSLSSNMTFHPITSRFSKIENFNSFLSQWKILKVFISPQ